MYNPTGNPMMRMIQLMRSGQSPMGMMQEMAQQDPRAQQAMQMIQGKSPQQLRQMAQNMAREKGIDLDMVMRQMGLK